MRFILRVIFLLVLFSSGLLLGAFLFSGIQRRPAVSLQNCTQGSCLSTKDIGATLGAIGLQKLPEVLPGVEMETDKTLAMRHPFPYVPTHFVIIPKRDIKDPGDIREGDAAYIADAFAVITALVQKYNLTKYRVIANGPGYQSVSYLHFHLLGPGAEDK